MRHEFPYILTDVEVYSLNDLTRIKTGEFMNNWKTLVDLCCKHVLGCEVSLLPPIHG